MSKKAFVITDLGPGDGGKGGAVHKICTTMKAHTVVKTGGAQGSHGVRTKRGESFNFSHFGCGTFEGVRTHISKAMVIEPLGLLHEGELLQYKFGIRNVFEMLTLDENVLCTTPYHRVASQFRELHRKDQPKGTIGLGVGEAVRDDRLNPELSIRVKDFTSEEHLESKLEAIRLHKLAELNAIMSGTFFAEDVGLVETLSHILHNQELVKGFANNFYRLKQTVRIVGSEYLESKVLKGDGVVVFEPSHGILTDYHYGFVPHTTQLRTVPSVTLDLLKECNYQGDVVKLGVTRAYQIRHGAGPMVTADEDMARKLMSGSNRDENRWQGKVRVGPLDFVSLRYAVNVCGGPSFFDGIAVTWFDQIPLFGNWSICDKYNGCDDPNFFQPNGDIRVHPEDYPYKFVYQEELGKRLNRCRPDVTNFPVYPGTTEDEMIDLCDGVLKEKLGVSLSMISFGPTEDDKVCL